MSTKRQTKLREAEVAQLEASAEPALETDSNAIAVAEHLPAEDTAPPAVMDEHQAEKMYWAIVERKARSDEQTPFVPSDGDWMIIALHGGGLAGMNDQAGRIRSRLQAEEDLETTVETLKAEHRACQERLHDREEEFKAIVEEYVAKREAARAKVQQAELAVMNAFSKMLDVETRARRVLQETTDPKLLKVIERVRAEGRRWRLGELAPDGFLARGDMMRDTARKMVAGKTSILNRLLAIARNPIAGYKYRESEDNAAE